MLIAFFLNDVQKKAATFWLSLGDLGGVPCLPVCRASALPFELRGGILILLLFMLFLWALFMKVISILN